MRRALLLVVPLLCACPPTLEAVDAGPQLNPSYKHAHNDYEHARPLLDALEQHFESVEADIWLDGNGSDLGVSHGGAPFKGTLRALYLEPLKERVAANGGSVHGDGKPFFLWIDLKDGSRSLQDVLATQLASYDFLTQFDDAGPTRQGAVTVLLTGDASAKKALAARAAPRSWARDSNDYTADDPPADGQWVTYAVNYFSFFTWDGTGAMPAKQRAQLENLVAGAHAKGRTLRIYASPDTEAFWLAARDAHVDFINTDQLADLARALSP